MVTVLAVYNSEGCVGRCDANCYMAKGPDCHCICGGRNHGGGLKKAMEANQANFGVQPGDLEQFAEAHGYKPADLTVIDRLSVRSARRARKLARDRLDPQPTPLLDKVP